MDEFIRSFELGRVIDGDTLADITVDLGYHTKASEIEYRVARINAPEMHGPSAAAGAVAKAYTQDWITIHSRHGGLFAKSKLTDSFGRYLAEITCGQGHNLSDDLLSSGNAILYKAKS